MSRKPDTYHEVRLTSRRAPYRRAGIAFASTRTPVIVPADQLSDDQLDKLQADPAIVIEVIDAATGDVVALQTEGGTAIGIGGETGGPSTDAPPASGTGEASSDAPPQGAGTGEASRDAPPQAAGAGESAGGQTGAGSVSPAPTTEPSSSGDQAATPASDGTTAPKPAKPRSSRKIV